MYESTHLVNNSLLPPSMFVGSDVEIICHGCHFRRCCERFGVVEVVRSLGFGARHCSTQTHRMKRGKLDLSIFAIPHDTLGISNHVIKTHPAGYLMYPDCIPPKFETRRCETDEAVTSSTHYGW
jgi:hypothetical protein